MGPKAAMGFLRARTVPLCAIALILLTVPVPSRLLAADITLSSRSYLLFYQRDVTGGATQNFSPFFEYLSADARNLGGTPVSFHFYGWGRLDLRDKTGSDNPSGDLGSAYLRYVHPTGNGEARLGRFFFAEGTAAEIMDGLFVKVRSPMGLGLALYGGLPVEQSISATRTGDSIFGGRLFFAQPGFAEVGVGYLVEKGTFQGEDRKVLGGDLWVRPAAYLELLGRAAYNDSTKAMAQQRYVIRITPLPVLDVSLGYESYRYKDLFQTALNPAFRSPAVDNADKVRILFVVLDWQAMKNLTVEAALKNVKHDLSDPGKANRGELGVRYSYNDRKDVAGASIAVVTADQDENAYQEYRAFGSYSPGKWRFALDALAELYKKESAGKKEAYQVVGSAGYQVFQILQVSGDLTYTRSPRFESDYAGLVRASLQLGTATGGKK